MTGLPPRSTLEEGTATLQTRCKPEIKQRFRALARQQGLTESMLLRRMVSFVLAQASHASLPLSTTGTRGGLGGHGGQIKLRLRAAEIHAIRAMAEPEGYSAQAWIVLQLRHRLEDAVPFATEELNALREALRELGALGRNLNKLLHILQRSDRFLEGQLDLQSMAASVERLRRAVTETVTRATHRGHHDGR